MIIEFNTFITENIKTLKITKLTLDEVCQNFNLDINNLKFIASGYYGNAYSIDDKVLKITSDVREINDVHSIIGKKLQGIVNYYKMGKVRNTSYYAILMERVKPFEERMNKLKKYTPEMAASYTDSIFEIVYKNWGKFNNYKHFVNILENADFSIRDNMFESWICKKIFVANYTKNGYLKFFN